MADLTPHEIKQRHVELHQSLDELVACFVYETGKLFSKTSVMELVEWSHQMTKKPTCISHDKK